MEDMTTRKTTVGSVLAAMVVLAALGGCGADSPTGPSTLQVEELTVGTGATAVAGDVVTVRYVGMFLDGRVFDPGAQPITFQVGAGVLIPGFEQGVLGMRVGGRRRITIPSSLAYGAQGFPPTIPPNTALRFDIDLVAIAGK